MVLHPEVNLSLNLYEKLEHGKLDLAIVPGGYRGELVSEFLGDIELKCMCNPMRLACPDRLEIGELVRYPLISQTDRSALQATVEDHFRRNNVAPTTRLSCNSLSAISGLALGGLALESFRSGSTCPEWHLGS